MANSKKSTIGGIPYDDLCRGTKKYYSFNLVDLVDTSSDPQPLPFNIAVETLVKQVESTFNDIRFQQDDKELEAFTIGKTHARRVSTKRGPYGRSFHPFDRKDPRTWKLDNGINNRWRDYFHNQNYDGLVALTAITNDIIPNEIKQAHEFISVEQYSIALEQSLIRQWVLNKPDSRLANESFHPGNLCKGGSPYAGVVYVAFKLRDVDELNNLENNPHDYMCNIFPESRTGTTASDGKRILSPFSQIQLASSIRDTETVATLQDGKTDSEEISGKPTKGTQRKRTISSETQLQSREELAATASGQSSLELSSHNNRTIEDPNREKSATNTSRKRVCFDITYKEEIVKCPISRAQQMPPHDFEICEGKCQWNKKKKKNKRKRIDNYDRNISKPASAEKVPSKSGTWSLTDSPTKHSTSGHRRTNSRPYKACSQISNDETVNDFSELQVTAKVLSKSTSTTRVCQILQRKGKSISSSKESTSFQKPSTQKTCAAIQEDKFLDQVESVSKDSINESSCKESCVETSKRKARNTKVINLFTGHFVSNDYDMSKPIVVKVPVADDVLLSSENGKSTFEKQTYICSNETMSILQKHPLKKISFPTKKLPTDGYSNNHDNKSNSLGLQLDSKADLRKFLECLSTDEWQGHEDYGQPEENQHQSYQCSFCGELFEDRDEFDRHENIHTLDILFLCKYCRKAFSTDSTCTRHEKIHENRAIEEQVTPWEDDVETIEETMDHNGGCGTYRSQSSASTIQAAPALTFQESERGMYKTSKSSKLTTAKSNVVSVTDTPYLHDLKTNEFKSSGKSPTKQLTINHFFISHDTQANSTDDEKRCQITDTITSVEVDKNYPQEVIFLDESDDDEKDNNSSKNGNICGYCSRLFTDISSRKKHEQRHHISLD